MCNNYNNMNIAEYSDWSINNCVFKNILTSKENNRKYTLKYILLKKIMPCICIMPNFLNIITNS